MKIVVNSQGVSALKPTLAESYTFRVVWSEEDEEYVATVEEFPSLSHLDIRPTDALNGIIKLVEGVLIDLAEDGKDPPEPKGSKFEGRSAQMNIPINFRGWHVVSAYVPKGAMRGFISLVDTWQGTIHRHKMEVDFRGAGAFFGDIRSPDGSTVWLDEGDFKERARLFWAIREKLYGDGNPYILQSS